MNCSISWIMWVRVVRSSDWWFMNYDGQKICLSLQRSVAKCVKSYSLWTKYYWINGLWGQRNRDGLYSGEIRNQDFYRDTNMQFLCSFLWGFRILLDFSRQYENNLLFKFRKKIRIPKYKRNETFRWPLVSVNEIYSIYNNKTAKRVINDTKFT